MDEVQFLPFALHKEILEQLHSNHMGIEKMQLIARESVLWINMDVNIEHTVKQCAMFLVYQSMQP